MVEKKTDGASLEISPAEEGREGPLVIDLHSILRKRLPRKTSALLPDFVISALARLIRQKELNEILRVTYPLRGWRFSERVLEHLGITLEVNGIENVPENSRLMFASNHPLGGLDGIALISVLGKKYGDNGIRFLVNDMLMNVEPLKDLFLPVNKFGRQGREAAVAINDTMASDMQVFQFPAGLCSRRGAGGEIKDLEWQKSFVSKAIEFERDIIPVYFEGSNSSLFYATAQWRKRLGVGFNVEQILLPSEVCKARGKKFRIVFGRPVGWKELKASGENAVDLAATLRERSYSLAKE